jgi:hypothetical protein
MCHIVKAGLRVVPTVIGLLTLVVAMGSNKAIAEDQPGEASPWDAKYVGMEVPTQVLTDQVFPGRITVRNTGTAAWTGIPYSDHAQPHPVLYSQNPERNKTWGTDFAYMGQGLEVKPEQDFTFAPHFKAPSTPGEYGFEWRLAWRTRDGKLVFFGESTERKVIKVQQRPVAPTPASRSRSATGKKVLTIDDFQYAGSFRIPEKVGDGGAGFSEIGMTVRKMKDGKNRLLMNFTHPRQTLFEVEVPALARFDRGDAKPLCMAEVKTVWGSLGMAIPKIADIERISPNGGLLWDADKRILYWTFYHGYWTGPAFPVLAASKLDDDGKVASVGCWRLPKTVNKWKSYWGGVTRLSQDFARTYTGGRTLALGFGGYYSICAACSRGPALAAIAEPDPTKDTMDAVELLDYPDPAASPRDGNYFYGLGNIWYKVPDGPSRGWWTMDDMCRSGVLIDLPDKHGYIAFVRLATGRIGYDYAAIGSAGACHSWYIYDPKDLGEAAKGTQKPSEIVPYSMTRVSYPDQGERVLQRAQEQGQPHASGLAPPVNGCCFDAEERLLYVLKPCAVEVGKEHHPCVHVYRVASSK